MRVALTIVFLLVYGFSHAQAQKRMCGCAGDALWDERYFNIDNKLFDPVIIKAKGIKEATVMLTPQVKGRDRQFEDRGNPYTLAKYDFNDSGYVVKITEYSQEVPVLVKMYVRNAWGAVTKKLISSADSIGDINRNSYEYFVYDYYYEKGRLTKLNVTDKGFNGKPDVVTSRVSYEYDDKGREVKMRRTYKPRYDRFGADTSMDVTKYNAKGDTGITTSYEHRKPWLRTTTSFDAQGRVSNVSWIESKLDIFHSGYELHYNTQGRLQQFIFKGGFVVMCQDEDRGSYFNTYFYNAAGLPDIIRYTYDNVACLMKVTYK